MSRGHPWWAAALAAALFAAPAPSGAASLQVSPTTLEVPADRSAAGLTLRNNGASPLTAQVRVFRWTQVDGDDVLEPTTALAASPPMLELPAGGEQLVRVIRLGPPPQSTEEAYRLVVDELPLEAGPGGERPGLRFVLRYSIPVFIAPAGEVATAPVLHARVTTLDGVRRLQLENIGNGRAQVADLAHVAADGSRTLIAEGLAGYVLPGQGRGWELPAALATASGGSFQARINGEAAPLTLALDH